MTELSRTSSCLPLPRLWLSLASCALAACVGADADPDPFPDHVTWHEHIAPLIHEKCGECHREGGLGPFDLTSYDKARALSAAVVAAVDSGAMPPFLAQETDECQPRLPWQDDPRLSERQKQLLRVWAETGASLGDPDDAARLPRIEPPTLREDVTVAVPGEVVIDGDDDLYTCVVLDPGLSEDIYINARSLRPGNDEVVHHVLSYVLVPGEDEAGNPQTKQDLQRIVRQQQGVELGQRYDCFGDTGLTGVLLEQLDAWAPGTGVNHSPRGTGQLISKESLIVLSIHYHPRGSGPETDRGTALVLSEMDVVPAYLAHPILLGNVDPTDDTWSSPYLTTRLLPNEGEDEPRFRIPGGARAHTETMTMTWRDLPEDIEYRIFGAGPHMHDLGRDMRVEVARADPEAGEPRDECLIQTPTWDFDWQRGYVYDAELSELPRMGNGDTLTLRCTYDNPFPEDVYLGGAYTDEMCLVGLGVVYPNFHALER